MRERTARERTRSIEARAEARRRPAPQSRDWALLQTLDRGAPAQARRSHPTTSAQGPALPNGLGPSPYVISVAWGTIWRYAVVGSVTLAMFSGVRPPLVTAAAIGVAGLILGLWRRRWWAAGLWRAAMLGWATGASSGSQFFPYLIAGSLAVVTLEPWLVARGRRAVESTSPGSAVAVAAPAAPVVA
ncbi:MAG: hypothetical protein WCB85_06075, partial [Candidatus Dormiibacterota bacterium]